MSRFRTSDPIFATEEPFREHYSPDTLHGRDEELDAIAQPLQPVINGDAPRNVLVHGNEGAGKSAAVQRIVEELQANVEDVPEVDLTVVSVQCRHLSSTYQLAIRIINSLRERREASPVPETGHPKSRIYEELFGEFDATGGIILLVLDEFDEIQSDRDEFLRNIPRALSEQTVTNSKLGILATANGYRIVDSLAPETKDSLNAELISFDPYTTDDLKEILLERARIAFVDDAVPEGVIARCAAIAAKNSGSARYACQVLHKAGLIARDEDPDADQVEDSHLREAVSRLEADHLISGLTALDQHAHLALVSLIKQSILAEGSVRTVNIYDYYSQLAQKYGFQPASKRHLQRRLDSMTRKGYLAKSTRKDDGNYNQYTLDIDLEIALEALDESEYEQVPEMAAELRSEAEDQYFVSTSD